MGASIHEAAQLCLTDAKVAELLVMWQLERKGTNLSYVECTNTGKKHFMVDNVELLGNYGETVRVATDDVQAFQVHPIFRRLPILRYG